MDRIYESGAVATPPAAPASPSTGYPTGGNPGTLTKATKPGPWWFYMITESLRAVIVDAGLTPDHTNLNLFKQALGAAFAKLGVANAWTKGQRGVPVAFPATTGTVTLDLAAGNNHEGTLTGNIVLANPSSMPVGQSGMIRPLQGASPGTISYGSYWKPADGTTLPALTAVAYANDGLPYYVESATRILIGKVGGSV